MPVGIQIRPGDSIPEPPADWTTSNVGIAVRPQPRLERGERVGRRIQPGRAARPGSVPDPDRRVADPSLASSKLVDAVTVKSRTFVAWKTLVRPSELVETSSPVVARSSRRSDVIVTRTSRLVGVTNGSAWLGRSKVTRRLTHGSQR